MSPKTAQIIGGIGRTFITTGVLILAFAAFQLWGTGIAEGRAQDDLASDFEDLRLAYSSATATSQPTPSAQPGTEPAGGVTDPAQSFDPEQPLDPAQSQDPAQSVPEPPTVAPKIPRELLPKPGDALGVIRIPKIDVDKVIIQGVARDDLRKGPGHYANTVLPGQEGNAAIAGHRTTYGAPFGDLDLLVPGDVIEVDTFQGTFFYEVLPQVQEDGTELGHAIVSPYDVYVIDDYGDNRLTLTACHPKFSARERIAVHAELISEPVEFVELPDLPELEPSSEELAEIGEDGLAYDPTVCVDCEDPGAAGGLDEGNAIGNDADALDESLGWHMEELNRVLLFGMAAGLIALLAFVASRRWRRWPSYLAASPAFLLALFFAFTHLDRMLPAF